MKKFLLLALVALAAQTISARLLFVERNNELVFYFDLDSIEYAEHMRGWEWINTESYEMVNTKKGQARKYTSHPNYRVIGAAVYNTAGTLVYLTTMGNTIRTKFEVFGDDGITTNDVSDY